MLSEHHAQAAGPGGCSGERTDDLSGGGPGVGGEADREQVRKQTGQLQTEASAEKKGNREV